MLRDVANYVKAQRAKLIIKVPALNDVIEEYLKMEDGVYKGQTTNLTWQPAANALQKMITRTDFEQVVLKLSSAAMAAGVSTKQKKTKEKYLTLGGLKRLTAAGLCNEYIKAVASVKKIRNPEFYGITKDYMADAAAYYKEFNAIKGAPAKKKKERAEWNKNLDDAISDALAYLKQKLDPLMLVAGDGDPGMVKNYKAVRTVNTRGPGRPSDQEVAFRKSREKKKTG